MLLLLCVTVGFLHQDAAVSGCSWASVQVQSFSAAVTMFSIHVTQEGDLAKQGVNTMQSGCVYSCCKFTHCTILLHKGVIPKRRTHAQYNTEPNCLTAIVIKMFFLVLLATTEHPSGLTGRYVCLILNM